MDSDSRSSSPAESQEDSPGWFPFPYGTHRGKPIRDVPQDHVWWALRPDNMHERWYNAMYEDNKRLLDDKYKSCSPGSEPIWFGKAYRGHRLDMVYERKGFMEWCFSSERNKSGWIYRLEDLIRRLWEWREAHPTRHGPRRRRKAADIQNPVGEAIGPWNDDAGSAAEDDDYDKDGFVVSDNNKDESGDEESSDESGNEDESTDEDESRDKDSDLEDEVNGGKNPSNEGDLATDDTHDSDDSTSSDAEMTSHTHKRSRRNIVLSDSSESDEEEQEDPQTSARKLGRKYRVEVPEEEDIATARRASKRVRR